MKIEVDITESEGIGILLGIAITLGMVAIIICAVAKMVVP